LVVLTASYPFGVRTETFLENEVPILASRFDRVLILPSHRKPGLRSLPEGVELVEMQWLEGWDRLARLRALSDKAVIQILSSIVPRDWAAYGRGLRVYSDVLAQNVLKARALRSFIEARGLGSALFYDYWFENSTLALAILRASGQIPVAVARAHRFDLYDETWPAGRVPFREFKMKGLDRVYPVSDFGRRYLEQKAPWASESIEVQRLGVGQYPMSDRTDREAPLVVSCGTLLPRKRFHLVPEVLELVGGPVRWIHFGDGPDRKRVQSAATRLPDRVSWELRGDVPNSEVIRFYGDEPVDAFLSLSVSEGLPVSMMEAISFGIPLIGMNVHGIPEIVTRETGICLPLEATPARAASALSEVLTPGRFDRAAIREFFVRNYNASVNYTKFADDLISLWDARVTESVQPA
jgi:glycosyltransferase involved in cell wall biosynthesis